jgi:periplasmic divalent cation tolerance protein
MIEIVFCTVPDAETAERLARGLVEQRLAACVNVITAVRSFYRWEGAIQADDEAILKIKTTHARRDALISWLGEHHPYEVPEIVAVPVAGGGELYLDFVERETERAED